MAERLAQVATTVSYAAGGSTTVFGLLSLSEMAIIVGMVVGISTFVVNWIYRHKHYQLEAQKVEIMKQPPSKQCKEDNF